MEKNKFTKTILQGSQTEEQIQNTRVCFWWTTDDFGGNRVDFHREYCFIEVLLRHCTAVKIFGDGGFTLHSATSNSPSQINQA